MLDDTYNVQYHGPKIATTCDNYGTMYDTYYYYPLPPPTTDDAMPSLARFPLPPLMAATAALRELN